jgi:CheY-like chemotaxis protein
MKEILLVEDSPTDARLLQDALQAVGIVNPVNWIWDGTRALNHLQQVELTAPIAPVVPSILFLDLKLSGVTGFEILKYLEGRTVFADMLCVALSHMTDVLSVKRAYRYGAYSFLAKPIQSGDLREVIRSFPGHWMFGRKPDSVLVQSSPAVAI